MNGSIQTLIWGWVACLAIITLSEMNLLTSSSPFRRMADDDDDDDDKTLRVAAFGSSATWGTGVKNRLEDAYPYKLGGSNNNNNNKKNVVDNFASFSSGPNYPSVCTQTIMGQEQEYDVILLEFWQTADQGLPGLAKRLRKRFPNAMIIFMKFWGPYHVRRIGNDKEKGSTTMTFREWKEQQQEEKNGITTNDADSPVAAFHELMQRLIVDDADWSFLNYPNADKILEDTAKEVNGVIYTMPRAATSGKETLIEYLHWFDKYSHLHLTETGHEMIANQTRTLIHQQWVAKHTNLRHLAGGGGGVSGDWGRGDACQLWYTSGACNLPYQEDAFEMVEFDEIHGKFALELHQPKGWLEVTNPFADVRTLYLSFLATQPGMYPLTTVEFSCDASGDDGSCQPKTVPLQPDAPQDTKMTHMVRTIPVGILKPGKNRLVFSTTDDADNKKLPFRLVGASFTNEEAVPLEFGFGPPFNV
mmetsp:Transcript_8779/g.20306  ORF Transcript_8779/g.20306 Transcript_8779/m.20306 type:complete len:473 (-) Transcript_8779:97-1515(-)